MTAGYFTVDPVMQRAQDIGAYAALLGGEASNIGEHKAADFIFNTNIYYTTPSIFTQPGVAPGGNVGDQFGSGQVQNQFIQTSMIDQLLQFLMNLINQLMGKTQNPTTDPTTEPTTNPTTEGKDKDGIVADRHTEVDKIKNKATSKKKFDNLIKDLDHINGSGPNGWYWLLIVPGIISGANSRAKVDAALKTIADMPKEEYAAFKQYFEEKTGNDLTELLTAKEGRRGVKSEAVDKVLEKDDEAMEWLAGE